jgi:hypothetical protein
MLTILRSGLNGSDASISLEVCIKRQEDAYAGYLYRFRSNVKNAVFWDVTPCDNGKSRRSGESIPSTITILTRATLRHTAEDGVRHSHRHENLKSYIALTGWALQWDVMCLL